jgi:hypothetical protein
MKVGVFTALLSQLPLEEVLKKLKAFQIDTVELGTGNYPGDAHCNLSMLENSSELAGPWCQHQRAQLSRQRATSERRPGAPGSRDKPQDDSAG